MKIRMPGLPANIPALPFKKKSKAETLDAAVKKLISNAKAVEKILDTVTGENQHTLNMKLCIEDTINIGGALRNNLKRPKKEANVKKSD